MLLHSNLIALATVIIACRLSSAKKLDPLTDYCDAVFKMNHSLTLEVKSYTGTKCRVSVVARSNHGMIINIPLPYRFCTQADVFIHGSSVNLCTNARSAIFKRTNYTRVDIVFKKNSNVRLVLRTRKYTIVITEYFSAIDVDAGECGIDEMDRDEESDQDEPCCYHGIYAGQQNTTKLTLCDVSSCIHHSLVCDDVYNCEDQSDEGSFCLPWWCWVLVAIGIVSFVLIVTYIVRRLKTLLKKKPEEKEATIEEYHASMTAAAELFF